MTSNIARVLEPEVMASDDEVEAYASIDNEAVNDDFVRAAAPLVPTDGIVLDIGTGPGDIPLSLARHGPEAWFVAVDGSPGMLRLAARRCAAQPAPVVLCQADAKALGLRTASVDMVISNSVVHHVPQPVDLFREIVRVLRPGGALYVRDLMRPWSARELDDLVARYAADDTPRQRAMFRESLHAALTVAEVRRVCHEVGLAVEVRAISDRRWVASRPAVASN